MGQTVRLADPVNQPRRASQPGRVSQPDRASQPVNQPDPTGHSARPSLPANQSGRASQPTSVGEQNQHRTIEKPNNPTFPTLRLQKGAQNHCKNQKNHKKQLLRYLQAVSI